MKLTPCDINCLAHVRRRYKKSASLLLLEEFIASGAYCCEVEGYPQSSVAVACGSLHASAKRYGFHQVGVVRRGEKVYLILRGEK